MTRDEIYKHIGAAVDQHSIVEQFEIRTSEAGESFSEIDLFAVRGAPQHHRFDYIETSLCMPNEIVVPELITGWTCVASPAESFERWSGKITVNGRTIDIWSVFGCMEYGPHRLAKPVLVRPGDHISALFEGPEVKAGSIALKLYGFYAPRCINLRKKP